MHATFPFVLPVFHPITHSSTHLTVQEVHRGFPDAKFAPTHAVVATWENVAAYEEQTRAAAPSNKVRWMESRWGSLIYRRNKARPVTLRAHAHIPHECSSVPVRDALQKPRRMCITCNQPGVGGLFVIPPYPPNLPLNLCKGSEVIFKGHQRTPSLFHYPPSSNSHTGRLKHASTIHAHMLCWPLRPSLFVSQLITRFTTAGLIGPLSDYSDSFSRLTQSIFSKQLCFEGH